ncbi:MAG: rhodanese-like domain-containing protein, partial [Planctomycetota bacterium]
MSSVLITPAELAAMPASETVIIDTRDPDSFAAGHIAGAVNIHDIFTYLATSDAAGMSELTEKFASAFGAAGLDGTKTAVLYEASMNSGFGQSCRGYFLLSYLGYPSVKVLHGGLAAWEAAEMPLTTEVAAPEP